MGSFLKGFELDLDLMGFSFSVIDNQPRELINVTIKNLQLKISDKEYQCDGHVESKTKINASLGLLQIDNLVNEDLPVILGPSSLYERQLIEIQEDQKVGDLYKRLNYIEIKNSEELKMAESLPFLKIAIDKSEKKYEGKLGSIIRYEYIHFAIQEFFLQAET